MRGAQVEGVLYQLSDSEQILRMDPYERVPVNYRREMVELTTRTGRVNAWTYLAQPGAMAPNLWPKADYLAHLLAGIAFVSEPYAQRLQQQPTLEQVIHERQADGQ